MMLSISSTLHEIEQAHKQGMNMKQIAEALNVNDKKMHSVLKAAGFKFNKSIKKWCYEGQDEGEILQRSFSSFDKPQESNPSNTENTDKPQESNPSNTENTDEPQESNPSNTENTDEPQESNPSNTENTDEPQESNPSNTENMKESNTDNMSNISFTQDEILILKQLATKYAAADPIADSSDVLEAIKDVPKGKTTKKTFAINDGVIEELDAFCDQHRIKKSDFVIMAIQDALKKFNK